jgi:23S rRNA (cytidine2498-2'-O)-methyltransferase
MSFVFATCRAGSEPSLKADVARWHEGRLTPAFMRPQLITWKVRGQPPDSGFVLDSPFARVSGLSLGLCASAAELIDKLRATGEHSLCLHAFPRETPEDGVPQETWQRIDARQAPIISALTDAGFQLRPASSLAHGDLVLDLVFDDADDAAFFAGLHRHHDGAHRQPGGLPRLTLPPHAPSRAWLKVEQALAWRGWDTPELQGRLALDLGCAPGGASLALLDRGMRVTGVDTGDMDEAVLRHDSGAFRHLRTPVGRLDPARLPAGVSLILCDINLAPPEVLPHIERLQRALRAPRLILTLKLNIPALERRLDEFVDFIRGFSPAPVHVTQLAANRREVCVTAGV